MGSLMAGWDSPIQDPKHVAYQRNKSFTKEEIEAYWRSKKRAEEELCRAATASSPAGDDRNRYVYEDAGAKMYKRSNSLPDAKGGDFMGMETAADWEKLIKNKGWWTRSNWAFLNEPPVFEGTTNSYAPQFHVANLRRSKLSDGAGPSP